jgi:hypothetical protein
MTKYDDIQVAFNFAVRVAIDQGVSQEYLAAMLHASYAEAEQLNRQRRSRVKPRVDSTKPKAGRRGSQ